MKIKLPKNKKQLQRVLGLLTWFRPYICNAAQCLLPLTDKLKTGAKFIWKTEDSNALQSVITDIKRQVLLEHLNTTLHFRLQTGASDRAAGSVLLQ